MTTMTMTLRRAGAVTAAAVLLTGAGGLVAAAALAADTTTVALKDAHKGAAATAFAGGSECAGYTGTATLWHFVVPALDASPKSTGPDITGIVATFAPASAYSYVVVQNGKGVDVFTTGSTTVTDATATLNGPIAVTNDAVLVLSHTCIGSGGGTTGGDTTGGSTGGDTTGGNTTGSDTTGGSTTGGSTTGGNTTGA